MRLEIERRGAAMPVTLLLIFLLTCGFLSAVARISAQVQELDSFRTETAAFTAAQGGLEEYLASGELVADTTMTVRGGTARVRATLIRPALQRGDSALYLIRSDGAAVGGGAKVSAGRRTVTQLAYRVEVAADEQPRWSEIRNAWLDNGRVQ